VKQGGHNFFLVHFSDMPINETDTWIDPIDGKTRPKSGVLFGPNDGYSQDEMFRRIENFPERNLTGSTNLDLGMDIVDQLSIGKQFANTQNAMRLSYMVIFTSGYYDKGLANCCPDPWEEAEIVQNEFRPNNIIPVISGKLAARNWTMLLDYTGYDETLPRYDVNSTSKAISVADAIVQRIKADIAAQELIPPTVKPTTPKPAVPIPNGHSYLTSTATTMQTTIMQTTTNTPPAG